MKREYHKWFSPSLGRDMELLVFGHAAFPLSSSPVRAVASLSLKTAAWSTQSTTSSNKAAYSSSASIRSTPKAGTTAPFLHVGASRVTCSTNSI